LHKGYAEICYFKCTGLRFATEKKGRTLAYDAVWGQYLDETGFLRWIRKKAWILGFLDAGFLSA
jgi:hypothetical protein